MKNIAPNKLYWASGNFLEFRIPGHVILDIARSGSNDAAVAKHVESVRQLAEKDNFPHRPAETSIRKELRECGAWDGEELKDYDANWSRLLWLFAWNIHDEDPPDCSLPCAATA
jgi:hypothetical protein